MVRELERKLSNKNAYKQVLELYNNVLKQQKNDTNKIYSLHEPNVKCICKDKEHKKYEFGNKGGWLPTQHTCVISV